MSADASDTRGRDVVVGFADRLKCGPALEKAIALVNDSVDARLVVVHVSSSPITVHNGPSPRVAESIGDPLWATVHSTVLELGAAPERTLTVIEPGEPASVIARHCTDASILYLGPSRRRRFRRRPDLCQQLDALVTCPVVQVAAVDDMPSTRSRTPHSNRSLSIRPGVTS